MDLHLQQPIMASVTHRRTNGVKIGSHLGRVLRRHNISEVLPPFRSSVGRYVRMKSPVIVCARSDSHGSLSVADRGGFNARSLARS